MNDTKPFLVTVSGTIPETIATAIADGVRPRADYLEMAAAFPAELLDRGKVTATGTRVGNAVQRVLGANVRMAWRCFREGDAYRAVLTDGEQVGIPLAVLTKLMPGKRRIRHIMIVHLMSVPKKANLFRWLRLQRQVDGFVTYSSAQSRCLIDQLGVPAAHVHRTPFMVDTHFFEPTSRSSNERPLICSAGLEFRDYATLIEAVRDVDVEVVIAAASPWSKRQNLVAGRALPPNVTTVSLDLDSLRALYARSTVAVMPLVENDFQAGVTTLLEAMSMGMPVVCTRTTGQTDVIEDGVTGVYVPPGDPIAMRTAICGLLADESRRRDMGERARQWVIEHADISVYTQQVRNIVEGASAG